MKKWISFRAIWSLVVFGAVMYALITRALSFEGAMLAFIAASLTRLELTICCKE